MASSWTNRGRYNALDAIFRGTALPASFNLALVSTTPTVDTNVFSDLTEIPSANGYTTGGTSIARNSTDFDVLTEDDTLDKALIQIIDKLWTAAGGPLPSTGSATYSVLLDNNATIANREVWMYWDLGGSRSVSDTQPFKLIDTQIELTTS